VAEHHAPGRFRDDRVRDAELGEAVLRVLRVTWRPIAEEGAVRKGLALALGR
jgi:hypothetical protein